MMTAIKSIMQDPGVKHILRHLYKLAKMIKATDSYDKMNYVNKMKVALNVISTGMLTSSR